MIELFDSHSHYNDEKFDNDRNEIIKQTYNSGVTRFMCIGYDIESSKKAIEIASNYDFIYATVGVSPNDIDNLPDGWEMVIRDLAHNNNVKAIGEIGLDYYWEKDESKRELQRECFIKQINIANEMNLPITIHTRDAYIDTINVLKENVVNNKGIFHCCPLNQELIKDGLNLGFYISFSGNITYKNAKSEEPVNLVPLDRILIETDSPYLTPEPYRGQRNTSINVIQVAKKIAEIKNKDLEEIAKTTYENAKKIYNIE